jgi:molybdate transport system ATP-binding protein
VRLVEDLKPTQPAKKRSSTPRATEKDTEFLAFDRVALRLGDDEVFPDTNWIWRRGEQWALLGPNGSGKSLIVQALQGLVPLAAGEIRAPEDSTGRAELPFSDTIAVVSPQAQRELVLVDGSFYQSRWHGAFDEGERTVAQLVSQESVEQINPFEVNPRRSNRREFAWRRRHFVSWLGMENLLKRKVVHLSNGEMRKVLLLYSLLRAPRLLILDDPYAGLDVATRKKLRGVVRRVMRAGWPVLLITHRLDEIPALTTHVLLIEDRRVIAQGSRAKMLTLAARRFHTKGCSRLRTISQPQLRTSLAGKPLVELRNVTVVAGRKRILRDITWILKQGEQWALMGPNGAGKTTLLNLIQGDHPQIYAQNVVLFGCPSHSTQAVWQARRQIGWLSPELHLHYPPQWPVLDVVCSGFCNTLGLHEPCSRGRVAALQWLEMLGLAAEARRSFAELSMGQQRIVLLARAVVKRPKLLILDEPCQGLDAVHRHAILAAVDRVVAQTGAGLIFVTHRAGEMPRCITHILRLRAGKMVSCGPAATR